MIEGILSTPLEIRENIFLNLELKTRVNVELRSVLEKFLTGSTGLHLSTLAI